MYDPRIVRGNTYAAIVTQQEKVNDAPTWGGSGAANKEQRLPVKKMTGKIKKPRVSIKQ